LGVLNERQWRKAYMIEFLINDVVKDVFTFSVPPKSENLEFPQRITETPTFGGVVIDDYGNDTVKIHLSGNTVNEERKFIYRGNTKPPDYLTGEKEIFKLQKLFEKYGNIEDPDFTSKKMYLYDLSKMNLIQIAAGSPTQNYWRIINKGLKIKRAEDKPLTYNYELDLIGIIDDSHKPPPLFGEGFGEVLDKIQKVIAVIETVAEITEEAADAIDMLTQQIVNVKKFIEGLQNGSVLHNVESIMRKLPGGNSLWNATKSIMGTISKIQYLAGTSTSQTGGTNYSRDDSFSVSFNSNGGSYVAPVKAAYGNFAKKPGDPILAKYTFLGWHTAQGELFDFEKTEITKNITLYAKWQQIQATVTFNSRQGSAVQPQTVNIGAVVVQPESPPTRTGYAFEYWCTDSLATAKFDFLSVITGDIILYAKWRVVFTVAFNSNGGTLVQTQTVNTGEKIVYPLIPERENYLFGAWCADSTLNTVFNFNNPITGNITLYAKWTRITNNVTFNSNGGTPVQTQTVNIGGHAVKPPDPIKEGHTFQRWCSDEGLTQEFIFNTVSVNYPITLYAKFIINAYTVHFETNGGTETPDQSVNYQALLVYPPIPTKSGALFLRWCSDAEMTTEFNFSTPITGNITLFAKWHEGASA